METDRKYGAAMLNMFDTSIFPKLYQEDPRAAVAQTAAGHDGAAGVAAWHGWSGDFVIWADVHRARYPDGGHILGREQSEFASHTKTQQMQGGARGGLLYRDGGHTG